MEKNIKLPQFKKKSVYHFASHTIFIPAFFLSKHSTPYVLARGLALMASQMHIWLFG
jgi:hypothetical protein